MDAHNRRVIEEFRARGGKVGGMYDGMPLLVLHHVGARTGARRTNPVTYQRLDETGFAVFASNDAAAAHPDWYHNLRAHPRTVIEVGGRTIDVLARVADGAERERIWSRQKELNPLFAKFEERTTRQIPVVILETI
ncbi:nitroreductase family deazaflavin-dependent oxidoreductase [Actinomadura chibensis]|uniref:Nitroreductase family deazaflavin-dependent oxidoreductase n=1 Tax=Actinomadura chibensis TaxID=392828 RepID=A0A5D0P0F3_9ACTN|nr:nitroreductase family deazaflavin-dependent oxidoreductase [Actinomadura chibensis]